jgi:hypothetical protein
MNYLILVLIGLLIGSAAGFIAAKRKYRLRYKQETSQVLNCILIPPQSPTLVAYTVATHDSPELKRLIQSFRRNGIPLLVLGYGCKWQGFGNKVLWLEEQLSKQNLLESHIVLFVDAYDVINLGTASEIIEKFMKFNIDLVISGEKGCHPDPHLAEEFKNNSPPFRYPNSGGYIGYSRAVIEMLNSAKISPHEDDQRFVTRYVIQNAERCAVDTNCEIFLPLFDMGLTDLKITDDKSRILLREKGTLPCILHGNGPSKLLLQELFPI